ncbi:hypothetical protein [Candidatus Shikimatogenerans bostrichidophilus]|uniref:hypothetical protein n=1 Tax=Candidatus Shikimatogenerans bostrichidophilus TaxID=2943807 RepID=UPI0029669783
MRKLKLFIPLITPLDNNNNIDYFSFEKLILYINNFKYINYIILFSNFSEYSFISNNEKIDIINCIKNNNKNIKIILKINNIYNYNDIEEILSQNIYNNINYIIIDYPNINNIYQEEIINNLNKIFNKFKYLFFIINIKNYIDDNILLKIKNKNNNFIGIINNYLITNYELINNIKIFINNDIDLFLINKIFNNIDGIISPLLNILFNYIYNKIIIKINNNQYIEYDEKYYKFIELINILYNKINPISGIKYLLNKINICKYFIKLPCNNIENIKIYKKLEKLYNIINI